MRERICLNGEWLFSPDYEGRAPDDFLKSGLTWEQLPVRVPSSWRWSLDLNHFFQPYDLFSYPPEWNQAQSGFLRRKIHVDIPSGKRAILILNGVMQRSAVYINDRLVGAETESYLPLEWDITDYLVNGEENDLKVWCGPIEKLDTPMGTKALAPTGSWFAGLARGIWQDVFLEIRSPIFIEQVWIKTSFRRKDIELKCDLWSPLGSGEGLLHTSIWDGDRLVKELNSHKVKFDGKNTTSVHILEPWSNPVLWSPENPHLYWVKVDLEIDHQFVDQKAIRFGFREVWTEGRNFYLNGIRINLRGDAWHYQGFVQQTPEYARNWYQACKETGINFIRLHAMPYPEFYLDVADEVGMLIVDESAIYGSGKACYSDHPKFLEECHRHLARLVRRDQHHPSVIIWSMQNEMRWVDGREGYKAAMPALTHSIKSLDDTRPVSYDGDNRLVDEKDMEIVSMHYNIDGTVAGWNKTKPLIFGEHGPWHYVSPQTCSHLAGQNAYLSFEACQESMGLYERLFIEYARREDVTGITPFNMSNYMVYAMPQKDVLLAWESLSTPGPKPRRVPAYATTINNGLLPNDPLFIPNPSWKHIAAAFKPVTIFRNEYNTSFFAGKPLRRSFSIYNDTESDQQARLVYQFFLSQMPGLILDQGVFQFQQKAGERFEWDHIFQIPNVMEPSNLTLRIELYHQEKLVEVFIQEYKVFPGMESPINQKGKKFAYLGSTDSYKMILSYIPNLIHLNPDSRWFEGVDVLIIGPRYDRDFRLIQPLLQKFVETGGSLIILEQQDQAVGDLHLSGKAFYQTFMTDRDHPIFAGLSDADLGMWGEENIITGTAGYLVQNAFEKPVEGDFKALLECGMGDFGWGGLLWTPLIEYSLGKGKVILNQVNLLERVQDVPQAVILLRNILEYAADQPQDHSYLTTGLFCSPKDDFQRFFEQAGLDFQIVSDLEGEGLQDVILLVADVLEPAKALMLRSWVEAGRKLVVLASEKRHESILSLLIGEEVSVEDAPVYQVKTKPSFLTRFISAHDTYGMERVTYTPATYQNFLLCKNAIHLPRGVPLFESVKNPWQEYFIHHLDAEYHKVAIATMVKDSEFQPRIYGWDVQLGKGQIIFCQVLPSMDNPKSIRFYNRFLANLGCRIRTKLLEYLKQDVDFGIDAMMALKKEPYHDIHLMERYFFDAEYILNNLGEGVFGWMKRVEKSGQFIRIPAEKGDIYFLTAFIYSEINRDPSQRATNELPDPSIVPDMYLNVNCRCKLYLNGKCYADLPNGTKGNLKIEDALLHKGINRLAVLCQSNQEDILLNVWFLNKFGDPLPGIRTQLTLD